MSSTMWTQDRSNQSHLLFRVLHKCLSNHSESHLCSISTSTKTCSNCGTVHFNYMAIISCLSFEARRAMTCSGLTDDQLNNHTQIIKQLSDRYNAGRNCHVRRHLFTAKKQVANQSFGDWLCELRDLARKCEFGSNCCISCEPMRIFGQAINGVYNDEVRKTLL